MGGGVGGGTMCGNGGSRTIGGRLRVVYGVIGHGESISGLALTVWGVHTMNDSFIRQAGA